MDSERSLLACGSIAVSSPAVSARINLQSFRMFARRLFAIAFWYGVIALAPMYVLEDWIGTQSPPAITHPEFYYGFVGVALAWQFAFLIIAQDPVRYRPIMIPSILEKLGFGVACVVLFASQRITSSMFVCGLVDLIFAGLFTYAYVQTRAKV